MDSEIQEDSILYELVVFSEWSLEQDVVVSCTSYFFTLQREK